MDKKVIGKISSGPLALMIITIIANIATEMKIYVEDRKGQKVMEIDRNAKNDDIQKLIDLLTGNENYRYIVVFEATVPWMYINETFLNAFNIPNCCEIKVL